jgi:membrane fusion protein (multidrug efflux system)
VMQVKLANRYWIVSLALLALIAAGGCRETEAGAVSEPALAPTLTVAVAPAGERTLTRTAQVQGAMFPREQTTLASEVEGSVVAVLADFGDPVKQGQILMRIDPREYQLHVDSARATLDQARARLANSQADFERLNELKRQGLISPQQFDKTSATLQVDQADLESAEKALALARKKLDDTAIRAPFGGAVQKRMASLGEYVMPGKQLYQIIATDPIKLHCPIPERFVPMAKVGMPVKVAVDARPGITYTGKITRIAPALDEASRTLLVEAEVPNPEGVLKPGFFAHVTIDLGQDRALFVPNSAILRYAGVARVFVVTNGVARSREVETGTTEGGFIEITKGLNAGERVITTDVDRMADGVKVVAKEDRQRS